MRPTGRRARPFQEGVPDSTGDRASTGRLAGAICPRSVVDRGRVRRRHDHLAVGRGGLRGPFLAKSRACCRRCRDRVRPVRVRRRRPSIPSTSDPTRQLAHDADVLDMCLYVREPAPNVVRVLLPPRVLF